MLKQWPIQRKLLLLMLVSFIVTCALEVLDGIRIYRDIVTAGIETNAIEFLKPSEDLQRALAARLRAEIDLAAGTGRESDVSGKNGTISNANAVISDAALLPGRQGMREVASKLAVAVTHLVSDHMDLHGDDPLASYRDAFDGTEAMMAENLNQFQLLGDSDPNMVRLFLIAHEILPGVVRSRAEFFGTLAWANAASAAHTGARPDPERFASALEVHAKRMKLYAEQIQRAEVVPEMRSVADALDQYAIDLLHFREAMAALPATPTAAAVAELRVTDAKMVGLSLKTWTAITNLGEAGLNRRLEKFWMTFWLHTGVAAAASILAQCLMFLIIRDIARGITGLAKLMRDLAGGNLDVAVQGMGRGDELGDMSRAVEVLRENSREQRRLQHSERELAERLRETAGEVIEAVEAIRSAASEISQGSVDLANRTERQAANLQQTVTVMGEIALTVQANAENSEAARKLASGALGNAEAGSQAMTNVASAIGGIEASSSRISEIIQVMEEIAFQTKILALNAAVEAARAGESGKGFAVVAQEVRSLADRSRQASQQIRELIADSTRQVAQGVGISGTAGDALGRILTTVRNVAEIMPEIAAASSEQARSISEVKRTLADLDSATQQNAALVEESSAAAASLSAQAAHLHDLVASLRGGNPEPAPAAPRAKLAPVSRRPPMRSRAEAAEAADDWKTF